MGYGVHRALQEKVCRWRKLTIVEQLKLAIIEEWRNLGQRFIDRSINEWRQHLQKVVEKQGDTLNMFSD